MSSARLHCCRWKTQCRVHRISVAAAVLHLCDRTAIPADTGGIPKALCSRAAGRG